MAGAYERFIRSTLTAVEARELVEVDALATRLRDYPTLNAHLVTEAHVHGARSAAIQLLLSDILGELGFDEEVILTPQDGLVTRARPDFVFNLGAGRGILAEVERGGTVTNNHDLKDLWKAHIASDAQHLFLVVPRANVRADGTPREKPYVRVVNRIGAFFGDERREVDVVSAHIFGY